MGFLEYEYTAPTELLLTGVPGVATPVVVSPGANINYQGDESMLGAVFAWMAVAHPEIRLIKASDHLGFLEPPPLTTEELIAERRRLYHIERLMADSAPDTKGSEKLRKWWKRIKDD